MYYISRRINESKYGVIDTEDGVEESLSTSDIQYAVLRLGIDVHGVQRDAQGSITSIGVYQNEDFLSSKQVKLQVMRGITIKTLGDEIVSISRDIRFADKYDEIRLSDWGSSCGNYIIADFPDGRREDASFLRIILDDKIKFKSKTFKDCVGLWVDFDIHELIDNKRASYIYNELIATFGLSMTSLGRYVKDSDSRLDYWKAVAILYNGFALGERWTHIREVLPNSGHINDLIDKNYTREFLKLEDCDLHFRQRNLDTLCNQFLTLFNLSKYSDLLYTEDFDKLKEDGLEFYFLYLLGYTTCGEAAIRRYKNYIKHFNVSPEVKKSFVRFCHRGLNWFYDYGRRVGVIKR